MTKMESVLSKSKLDIKVDWNAIILIIISFLLARVSILDKLYPFGISFLGSYLIFKKENKAVLFASLAGTLTALKFGGISYYISSHLIYAFFTLYSENKKYSLINASVINALIFVLVRFGVLTFMGSMVVYDMILVAFEGILVFTMTYVFSFSIPMEELGNKEISNEKMICSFVTLALILSGINSISIFGASIKNIISILLILLLSYNQGIFIGGITGIILGMISYISEVEMPFIISILAVGGMLAGLFRELGKSGAIIGFILGNSIVSFYVNGLGTSFLGYKELLISSLAFLAIYNRMDSSLTSLFHPTSKVRKEFENRKFEIASNKLDNMARLLESMARTYKQKAEEDDVFSSYGVYGIIDEIKEECSACKNHQICWEKSYYTTYYSLFTAIGVLESDVENKDDLLVSILKSCDNLEENKKALEEAYLKYKEIENGNKIIQEQRQVLVQQLEGLSKVVSNINLDVYKHSTFNEELEELLEKELKNKRFDLKDIVVAQLTPDNMEIYLQFASGNSVDRVGRVSKIISNALGYPMTADFTLGSIENSNSMKLVRTTRYGSLTKVATLPNSENGISGDNFTFGDVENTSFVAISDGMGTGSKANYESSTAISILEKMMEVNLDRQMTIKTINDILRTSSRDESFTTMDLSFIDLYKGRLQSIKSGASPTFIKGREGVRIINSYSLPIGILKNIHLNIYEESIEDGDLIIMMSDGVLDSNKDKGRNPENWMTEVIEGLNSQSPQAIADEILQIAKLSSGNEIKDDMTVMVTKVWRNNN